MSVFYFFTVLAFDILSFYGFNWFEKLSPAWCVCHFCKTNTHLDDFWLRNSSLCRSILILISLRYVILGAQKCWYVFFCLVLEVLWWFLTTYESCFNIFRCQVNPTYHISAHVITGLRNLYLGLLSILLQLICGPLVVSWLSYF